MSTQSTFSFPKHIGRLLQVFEPVPDEEVSGELLLYEAGGTLLNNQIPSNYGYWSQKQQTEVGVLGEEKHLNQDHHHHHNQLLNISAQHLANSIQLSTISSHANAFSSTLTSPTSAHMLLSNPSSSHVRGFHSRIPVALESQGLSLSLSSSLQNLETTKLEELREENDGIFFANQGGSVGDSLNPHGSINLGRSDDHRHPLHEEGTVLHGHGQVQVGFGNGTYLETVNVLRNSKYFKAAQELLEQLCPVGRVRFKDHRLTEQHTNPNPSTVYSSGVGSSSLKEHPPLTAADEKEYQRRKVKLLSMLDEVDTRYRNYCENMQAMVDWFDSVMGFGAAMTYTNLGRKAISQHFRRTKDAIVAQLKLTCELLGEKDVVLTGKSGLTKGETPRLRLVEQSLRQQKTLHYMGMSGLEPWRPQRSLPERSVNTLRAWLFEHFLHPYPSDADKHYLTRQTGLSKNQVSNWFINARVRLWKPMVEEMYQQETKEDEDSAGKEVIKSSEPNSSEDHSGNLSAQTPMRGTTTASDPPPPPPPPLGGGKSSNVNATEKDPSQNTINCRQYTLGNQLMLQVTQEPDFCNWGMNVDDVCCHAGIAEIGNITAGADVASSLVTFGTPAGDVSLTLGLPQTGNVPEKSHLSVRKFGAC